MARTKLIPIRLRCPVAGVMLAVALLACSPDRDNHDHPNLKTGEELFNYHCVECHGEDGTGKLVDRTPANILTGKDLRGIEDYIISDTGRGRKMPVFASMPGPEAKRIAAYLLVLKDRYDNLGENQRKNRQLLIDPEQAEQDRK
jgi:mono/diheme cytochrome c family protein